MTDVVDPNLARCATCGKYFIQHVEKWSRYATCGKFKGKPEGMQGREDKSEDEVRGMLKDKLEDEVAE